MDPSEQCALCGHTRSVHRDRPGCTGPFLDECRKGCDSFAQDLAQAYGFRLRVAGHPTVHAARRMHNDPLADCESACGQTGALSSEVLQQLATDAAITCKDCLAELPVVTPAERRVYELIDTAVDEALEGLEHLKAGDTAFLSELVYTLHTRVGDRVVVRDAEE